MKHGSRKCSKEDLQDTSGEGKPEKVPTLRSSATSSKTAKKQKLLLIFKKLKQEFIN
jgi:hypothetical protein